MSGIKSAEVRHGLKRTAEFVREQVDAYNRSAESLKNVGRSDFQRKADDAKSSHDGLSRSFPSDLTRYLEGEMGRWKTLVRNHDEAYAAAQEAVRTVSAKEEDLRARRNECERMLADLNAGIMRVQRSLRNKDANNHGWYCDREEAQSQQLRASAKSILNDMRCSMRLAETVQSLRRTAFTRYTEAVTRACEAQREYDRLVALGDGRKEQERIQEERKRRALNLKDDLQSLRESVESLDYAKFGSRIYDTSVREEFRSVIATINEGRYGTAIDAATALREKLQRAVEEIGAAQRRWEEAKFSAEKMLSDAREEIGALDRGKLETYSGESVSKIEANFGALALAEQDIRAENFKDAEKRIADAVDGLRGTTAKADENERLFVRREELAESIMQALYDSNYDTPNYYLQNESDELSDLCVVASAPGGVGDMKMRIGLDGKVALEVANVAEGHENVCIERIRSMQERMAATDDIRFDMTDWGRAANQNKVHLDVGRQQTTERTLQRQRTM